MKNNTSKIIIGLLAILAFITVVSALPTTGAASGVTNNQANITCTAVTGSDTWVTYGQNPDGQIWRTENFTASAGTADIRVWGSPLMSSTLYYGKCCDETGCSIISQAFTTLPITQLTQTTYSAGWQNLSQSHFNVIYLMPNLLRGYTSVIPVTVFFGFTLGFVVMGYWRMNKSVRLVSIIFMLVGGFLVSQGSGLEFGVPGILQSIGAGALAAGIAGIMLSFIHR